MSTELKPFGFQATSIEWLKSRAKAIVALEPGLGKTVIAAVDMEPPCIVVCTAAMKFRWQFELNRWRPELKVQVIRNVREDLDRTADVWIINYDIVWKFKLPRAYTLVVDESHKVKNQGAKRTGAVMAHCKAAKRVRFLSGTPMMNRPMDMFTTLTAVGAIDMSWKTYGFKYCAGWETPWDTFDVSGASNLDELYERVAPNMLRLTKKQVAPDMPPQVFRIIELDGRIGKEEKSLIKDMDKGNLVLPVHSIPFQAISDIRREHSERKMPQVVKYIKDVLDANEEKKVVVFVHHRDSVLMLEEALKDYGCVKIYGGTSQEEAFSNVQAFQEDSSVRVFVGNLQAAGEGITLTAASHVVIAEPSWVPSEIQQAADRCHRIVGTIEPVMVDLLTVQGSIDAKMLWKVLDKLEVINAVIKETKLMNTERIAELLEELAVEFRGAVPPAEEEAPKAKAKAKPKPEPKPEPEPEPEPEVEEEPEMSDAELLGEVTESEKPATLEDVRAAAAAGIAAGKRDEIVALISDLGGKKVSDIPEDKYGDFVTAAAELVG